MFRSSTHYNNWIFEDEEALNNCRKNANQDFVNQNLSLLNININDAEKFFLTASEENAIVQSYFGLLKEFCKNFNPPMPKYVMSTSIHYYKRFYLNNSVMEYHPKNILVTCAYLAAKIEEFNLSMNQFVKNIKGNKEKAAETVLNNELLLLHKINYQLIVWHPYRPLEGFLIDIKTRYPSCRDPEKYREHIDLFIEQCLNTDAIFLLCPNQLALLAIIYAAEQCKESIKGYLHLLFDGNADEIAFIQKWMIKVTEMITRNDTLDKISLQGIKNKLNYVHSIREKYGMKEDSYEKNDE